MSSEAGRTGTLSGLWRALDTGAPELRRVRDEAEAPPEALSGLVGRQDVQRQVRSRRKDVGHELPTDWFTQKEIG